MGVGLLLMAAAGVLAYLADCLRQHDLARDPELRATLAYLAQVEERRSFRQTLLRLEEWRAGGTRMRHRRRALRVRPPRSVRALFLASYAMLAGGVLLSAVALHPGTLAGSAQTVAARDAASSGSGELSQVR